MNTNQVRNWTFTWYDEALPPWNPDKMKYMVYQPEICPTTGRAHFQGFITFKRSMKMGMVKKALLSNTVHIEVCQGTPEQARHYCMKPVEGCVCHHCMGEGLRIEGTLPTEHGVFETQGQRNDLKEVVAKIKNGASLHSIVDENTGAYLRYHGGIEKAIKILNPKKRNPQNPCVNWIIFGKSGVGKSWFTGEKFPEAYTGYLKGRNFWQNYRNEENAVYNEFVGEHMHYEVWKEICDRYPCSVDVKGGDAQYTTNMNVFTSNKDPRQWWTGKDWREMERRCNHIIYWLYGGNINCIVCQGECELVDEIAAWRINKDLP